MHKNLSERVTEEEEMTLSVGIRVCLQKRWAFELNLGRKMGVRKTELVWHSNLVPLLKKWLVCLRDREGAYHYLTLHYHRASYEVS